MQFIICRHNFRRFSFLAAIVLTFQWTCMCAPHFFFRTKSSAATTKDNVCYLKIKHRYRRFLHWNGAEINENMRHDRMQKEEITDKNELQWYVKWFIMTIIMVGLFFFRQKHGKTHITSEAKKGWEKSVLHWLPIFTQDFTGQKINTGKKENALKITANITRNSGCVCVCVWRFC